MRIAEFKFASLQYKKATACACTVLEEKKSSAELLSFLFHSIFGLDYLVARKSQEETVNLPTC